MSLSRIIEYCAMVTLIIVATIALAAPYGAKLAVTFGKLGLALGGAP